MSASTEKSALTKNDEVEVTIEKLVAGGDGLARHLKLPIFVARSAPGDRLRVRLTERKLSYARAEVIEVLSAGPGRREPPCRHFGDCGGCDLQHLEDRRQFEYKAAATLETLERIGRIELPAVELVAGDAWGYRTRTQLHATPPRERVPDQQALVGYHARQSRRIVEVDECPVLVPALEKIVRRLRSSLDEELPQRVDLTVGDGDTLSTAPVSEGLPHGEVTATVGELAFAFDARCFFQGHRQLLPRLLTAVIGEGKGAKAVDLYAGVGLFAVPLAARYDRVLAVEGERIAARYGRLNARRNGASNLEAVHRAVESWVADAGTDYDRVVVDPPRSGLSRAVVIWLKQCRSATVTYVSCHPAALARDLAALDAEFKVSALTLIDLFPQTGHIEIVVQLERR